MTPISPSLLYPRFTSVRAIASSLRVRLELEVQVLSTSHLLLRSLFLSLSTFRKSLPLSFCSLRWRPCISSRLVPNKRVYACICKDLDRVGWSRGSYVSTTFLVSDRRSEGRIVRRGPRLPSDGLRTA